MKFQYITLYNRFILLLNLLIYTQKEGIEKSKSIIKTMLKYDCYKYWQLILKPYLCIFFIEGCHWKKAKLCARIETRNFRWILHTAHKTLARWLKKCTNKANQLILIKTSNKTTKKHKIYKFSKHNFLFRIIKNIKYNKSPMNLQLPNVQRCEC